MLNRHEGVVDFARAVANTKLDVVKAIGFWETERLIGSKFDHGGANGLTGWGGPQGQTGPYGNRGADGVGYGADGRRGEDGSPGLEGLLGNLGQNGQNGSNLNVSLAGLVMDPDNLSFEVTDRGKTKSVVSFNTYNQFILLRAAGGDAGDGGRGGKGGTGGHGGRGGDGATGRPGGNTAATCNGGPGGDGGNGGNGGRGGPGGRGGDGGFGGNAASVTVAFTDPTALMALQIDVSGGRGGAGGGPGPGGDGGSGGNGGNGGAGGRPGSYTTTESYSYRDANGNTHYGTRTVTHYGSPGRPGRGGLGGSSGATGPMGSSGNPGKPGNPGTVQLVWKDNVGKVIERGFIGYNLRLVNFDVIDGMADGIFEPCEEIFISNVTLLNDGDMTVPIGSIFAVLSSENITVVDQNACDVPQLPPGQSIILAPTFRMKLADVPLPTAPGPFSTKYSFKTDCHLLKRQFLKSAVTFGVDVSWPVCITSISSPTQMARNETRPFIIVITNKSLIPYGVTPDTDTRIVLSFDAGLIPNDPRALGTRGKPWTVEIPLSAIEPGGSATVSIDVTVWEGSEYFDRTPWKVDLLLRGRLIEFSTQRVRTCPDWDNFVDTPQDVIMFTGEHFQLAHYLAWKRICQMLGLGLWMWDSERYRGISIDMANKDPHGVNSWRQARPGATILFPSNPNASQGLLFSDIVDHFKKFPMSNGEVGPGRYVDDSGFVFYGKEAEFIDKQLAWNGESIDIADWNLKFEGKHLPIFKPDDKDIMDKAVSLTKKIGEKDPAFPYRLMSIEKEVEKDSFLKYSYGTLLIKRVPFKKFSKLIFAPVALSANITENIDESKMSLMSPFGQCMLLLIAALPIHQKIRCLRSTNAPLMFSALAGKQELQLTPHDLLKVMLYRDLRSDLEHDEKQYPHGLALQQAIQTEPTVLAELNVRLGAFYSLERLSSKKSVFSSNKPIQAIKDAIKAEMFKTFGEDEYKQIKKSNEALIKEHKKMKMQQYFADGVLFLFEKK